MFAHQPKAKLAACLALLLAAAAGGLAFMLYSQQRPRFLTPDPRHQRAALRGRIRSCILAISSSVAQGNSLAKLGLGIKPVAHGTYTVLGTNLWLEVAIRREPKPQELDGIDDAHLVNNAGKVFKLRGALTSRTEDQGLLRNWLVDWESKRFRSTNNPSYKLQISLPNGGPQLAEIPLGPPLMDYE